MNKYFLLTNFSICFIVSFQAYGRVFCHKIKTKHTRARNYFSRLPGMSEIMHEKAAQQDNQSKSISNRPALTLQAWG